MIYTETNELKMLIAEKGKHIRAINDVYVPEHIDAETGELIPEHFPSYSDVIFLGAQIKNETEARELYVAEDIIGE